MTKHFLAVCLCIVTLSGCQSTNQSSRPESTYNQPGLASSSRVGEEAKDPALNRRYSSAEDQRLRAILRRAQQAHQNTKTAQATNLLAEANVNGRASALQDAFFRLSAKIYSRQCESQAAALALMSIQSPLAMDVPIFLQTCMALNELQCFLQAQVIAQQINDKHPQ